ncbi:Zinc finger, RING-type [Corchorus capsularis]|uniref:Zinc finger, RING-type n=1 Tax=Corchorus capsularis TaxID=210143 RepID=A0A1R3FYA0_COCAP|nr:Zinc finger, RING-type [Corchorus capsularis]
MLGLGRPFSFGCRQHHHDEHEDDIYNHGAPPDPCLVPVPVSLMVQSLKTQLPVMQYSRFVIKRSKSSGAAESESAHPITCIVCLNGVEPSDEVRELGSCNHVFHKDCLDAWIDHGNVTCPLCKSKLSNSNSRLGNDPWRMERMIYLFGQDVDFS